MKVIKKADIIKSVSETWKRTYYNLFQGTWKEVRRGSSEDYYKRLLDAKTEEEINTIIGNDLWTRNDCDECQKDQNMTIEYNVEEYTFNLCEDCLRKAIDAFRKQPK
jgi:hypothetical protein